MAEVADIAHGIVGGFANPTHQLIVDETVITVRVFAAGSQVYYFVKLSDKLAISTQDIGEVFRIIGDAALKAQLRIGAVKNEG